ncbi:SGNH/GDSL hydrolase family protein [Nocardioides sp. Soil805]|uniref:SGNH/GDSL hydrolase family protein n=1 Tax=Nocardioides sp. Soil805 TaxID=1736416 RepID=UPI00138F9646|nr:SGNH/GDSL hydrolase family protein [Nocardioides sp. Soil805]
MITRVDLRYAVPALLLVLLTAAALTVQLVERAGAGTSYCARHTLQSAERADLVSGSGRPVTVIGDSWSVGLGLDELSGSWPTRLPGRVSVAGFSGSGFSRTASPCGDQSFGTRALGLDRGDRVDVEASRGLVVVEGGLNDYDRSTTAITLGFARLVQALEGRRVVIVGPATAPSRAAAVPRVDRLLARLAAAAGVPYVATSDLRLPYLPDRLHLTPEGHAMFGDAVAARLAALGLLG